MASEFTEDSVREFLIANGGRVKNTDLVTYFKKFLNDPDRKDEMRGKFKNFVNTLATIKMDDNKEKILMLKKKYREDSAGGKFDTRAQSEPPSGPAAYDDRPDGAAPSRVKSDSNISAADQRMSSSTLSNDTGSLTSSQSTSSTRSLSSVGQEEDNNASILSVKERAKHLNRIESESEIQKVSSSNLGAVRKKEHRKVRDLEGDDTSSDGYSPLSAMEKEWLVKCSAAEYHLMHELLSKNPRLANVKEFTSGYTALHWAAKKGKPEVIKMLLSKPGVYVNQRTNGGYTPLHLAAIQGHEAIIELLTKTYNADSNIRDYSGKKAKQYLSNSASSRAQHVMSLDKQLLVSNRLSAKSGNERMDNGFTRNSGNRRSNRESAIKSLIRASTGAMKQTVMRSGWGSSEDVINERTPKSSPRNSAEPSPVIQRRKGSFNKNNDRDLMPPPGASSRHSSKSNKHKHSISKESLHSEDKKLSMVKQVPRSESEPNLGEIVQPSRTTFI